MVAHGNDEESVPEAGAETPSPPNTGDAEDDPPVFQLADPNAVFAPQEHTVTPTDVTGIEDSSNSLPSLEDAVEEEAAAAPAYGLPPPQRSHSPIPLPYHYQHETFIPEELPAPEMVAAEMPEEEEQLTEEYVAECLLLVEEFKKTLQEFPPRAGAPFRVADGQTFDRVLKFCIKLAAQDGASLKDFSGS